jgi:hypothetical protein|eukprot:6662630-Prymnesium_polylepis.1
MTLARSLARSCAIARVVALRRHCSASSSGYAALEHARLREELESVKVRMRKLEAAHPELQGRQAELQQELHVLRTENPDLRSA